MYSVGNAHDKFQGCTADVQAATGFQQSVPYLVVGVQTCRLDHDTSCSVRNEHKKFQGCTVDVQVVGVQTCRLGHYTLCCVGNVHNKIQGCTVDVQAATEFLTITT